MDSQGGQCISAVFPARPIPIEDMAQLLSQPEEIKTGVGGHRIKLSEEDQERLQTITQQLLRWVKK